MVETYAPIILSTIRSRLQEICAGCKPNYETWNWKDGLNQHVHICGYTPGEIFRHASENIINMSMWSILRSETYEKVYCFRANILVAKLIHLIIFTIIYS